METLLATNAVGDPTKAFLIGLFVGLLFGALAQASRFCLRSACVEFWSGGPRGRFGPSLGVWLFVFGAAVLGTQLLLRGDALNPDQVRQLTAPGTLSGAIVGGLMFGIGMVLARGCASRLLVLSATGNARALLAGLVITVVAQASLTGLLSPLREELSGLWIIPPGPRNMLAHLPEYTGLALGVATLALAGAVAVRNRLGPGRVLLSLGLGGTIALGWGLTAALSRVSFDPVSVGSVTFTGPSADTLMALITRPALELEFGIGLVPGVFVGSFLSAVARGEFKIQVFNAETGTVRYLVGACLMGFGGMLAGGCAVGAGVTGGSVFSLTAWVALFCMWLGAGACLFVQTARHALPLRYRAEGGTE